MPIQKPLIMNTHYKVCLCTFLISLSASLFAMEQLIQFQDQPIIKAKLYQKGYKHFVDYSHIDTELANKKKTALGIILAIDTYIKNYKNHTPCMPELKCPENKELITILFEENPAYMRIIQKN